MGGALYCFELAVEAVRFHAGRVASNTICVEFQLADYRAVEMEAALSTTTNEHEQQVWSDVNVGRSCLFECVGGEHELRERLTGEFLLLKVRAAGGSAAGGACRVPVPRPEANGSDGRLAFFESGRVTLFGLANEGAPGAGASPFCELLIAFKLSYFAKDPTEPAVSGLVTTNPKVMRSSRGTQTRPKKSRSAGVQTSKGKTKNRSAQTKELLEKRTSTALSENGDDHEHRYCPSCATRFKLRNNATFDAEQQTDPPREEPSQDVQQVEQPTEVVAGNSSGAPFLVNELIRSDLNRYPLLNQLRHEFGRLALSKMTPSVEQNSLRDNRRHIRCFATGNFFSTSHTHNSISNVGFNYFSRQSAAVRSRNAAAPPNRNSRPVRQTQPPQPNVRHSQEVIKQLERQQEQQQQQQDSLQQQLYRLEQQAQAALVREAATETEPIPLVPRIPVEDIETQTEKANVAVVDEPETVAIAHTKTKTTAMTPSAKKNHRPFPSNSSNTIKNSPNSANKENKPNDSESSDESASSSSSTTASSSSSSSSSTSSGSSSTEGSIAEEEAENKTTPTPDNVTSQKLGSIEEEISEAEFPKDSNRRHEHAGNKKQAVANVVSPVSKYLDKIRKQQESNVLDKASSVRTESVSSYSPSEAF